MAYSKSQRGSVLFIILIAVVLFAALSYAVSGMMRGGMEIGSEKAGIYTSEIMTYARSVRESINILRISNECDDNQISFERPPFDSSDTDYTNPDSPSDFSCHIFHPDGGAINFLTVNLLWLDQNKSSSANYGEYIFSGAHSIPNMGTDGDDSDPTMKEIIILIPWINKNLCQKINEKLDSTTKGQPIPKETDDIDMTTFKGVFGTWASVSENSSISGEAFGCIEGNTGTWANSYYFYHLLLAR